MYKIGEFSKITNLTVKTLHYYDEEGILKPSQYLENGYRLYSNEDFKIAKRIVLLRDLDFSIREIKDVLTNVETDEDLQYFLKEKQEMIEDKINNQKQLLKRLDSYLLPNISKGEKTMTYQMEIKEFEADEVATIRFVGSYQTMGEYLGRIYKYLKSNTAGAPYVCYHDGEYKEAADIEVCVPIKKHVSGTKEIKVLPKIKALVTTHIGPYDKLNLAYKAILDYAKDNNIEINWPSRERYIKGPGMVLKGNPEKYVTEIIIPITK
ncbi:MAG: MerR family transcriptional regulator [Coprobacillaceae bacterium]